MRKIKQDNFNGSGDYGDMFATLWVTDATTAAGNWIAVHTNNATNLAALEGFSFRAGDLSNADAIDGTVGIAVQSLTAPGTCQVQIGGRYATANVAAPAIGDVLCISTTAGRADVVAAQGWPYRVIGRALAAAVANVAPVDIYPHPMFLG